MSKIKRLIQKYQDHIEIPWKSDVATLQRVIFCVYNEKEELRLRAKVGEFEIATKGSGHQWIQLDLSDSFAFWLTSENYHDQYFKYPELLSDIMANYELFIKKQLQEAITKENGDEKSVVAILGVGSLFGFLKVKKLVDVLAPLVKGRLLVFFPGSYENNNYRLLDGYDGWNYLAVPLTADNEL